MLNEVADAVAKAALFLKPERVHVGARTHVSIAFHGAGRAITGTQRVHREARRLVLLDLRAASVNSQWPETGDLQCI